MDKLREEHDYVAGLLLDLCVFSQEMQLPTITIHKKTTDDRQITVWEINSRIPVRCEVITRPVANDLIAFVVYCRQMQM